MLTIRTLTHAITNAGAWEASIAITAKNVGWRILSCAYVFVWMEGTTHTFPILHSWSFPFQLNRSSSRFSANGKGCYYSGGYKPFVYARIYKIPDQISVEIRHYADPVISASLATKGCSDNYAYNDSAHSCFGIKRSTQIAIGICLLAVAAIIIIVSIFLIIKGCNCIKKATNKQSPASVPLTTAIPVATVATAQPAPNTQTPYQSTPMYTIPQNSMAPTQPFLNSQGYQAQYPQIPTAQPMYYAPQTNSAGL